MCLIFLFFFKQKTAYEMRISDWSSDVCSSDLSEIQPVLSPDIAVDHIAQMQRHANAERIAAGHGSPLIQQVQPIESGHRGIERGEVGRASCRERVCQYV